MNATTNFIPEDVTRDFSMAPVDERPKRTYRRRTPEEIAQEKAMKEAKKAEREAKKAEKESKKMATKKSTKTDETEKTEKKAVKKGNGQKVVMPSGDGGWSDPNNSIHKEYVYVEIELLDDCLGTGPSDKDLLKTFITKNAPDAPSREEEIAAIGEEEMVQKGTTVFYKGIFKEKNNHNVDVLDRYEGCRFNIDADDVVKKPFFWNYQMRGFFKDSCGLLSRASYGESANLKAYKKVIDGGIFVGPRRIGIDCAPYYFDDFGEMTPCDPLNLKVLQRPLRIQDKNGERTAIASSEVVPAGSRLKFYIAYTDPKNRDVIYEWLNYGADHGLGAWRNSGMGTFRWRELNSDWTPINPDPNEE